MAVQCCCIVFDLVGKRSKNSTDNLPPELFDTVEANNALYVLHPALSSSSTWCLSNRCLRQCRDRSLREVSTFGGGRVKPKRPGGKEGVLKHSNMSIGCKGDGVVRFNLDVEVCRIIEDGFDVFFLLLHTDLLDFARLGRVISVMRRIGTRGISNGGIESSSG
jgi:hypothetical protein